MIGFARSRSVSVPAPASGMGIASRERGMLRNHHAVLLDHLAVVLVPSVAIAVIAIAPHLRELRREQPGQSLNLLEVAVVPGEHRFAVLVRGGSEEDTAELPYTMTISEG